MQGSLDPTTGAVRRGPGSDDLLEELAEAVLLRGGDVMSLAPARIPGGKPAVARLRW